jgi:hypothetical protein
MWNTRYAYKTLVLIPQEKTDSKGKTELTLIDWSGINWLGVVQISTS